MSDNTESPGDVVSFIDVFAGSLAAGTLEGFLDRLLPRVHPDAHWHQPMARFAHGHAQIRRMYAPLYAVAPDLHGIIDRWAQTSDGALVEYTLHATVGRRSLQLPVVDRFVLVGGLAVSNHSYLDPLPLFPATAMRPLQATQLWRRFVPARGA